MKKGDNVSGGYSKEKEKKSLSSQKQRDVRFYLVLDLFHLTSVTLADGPLMVTQNSDLAVGTIVGQELFSHGAVGWSQYVQLILESKRGVVGTEHLGGQTRHEVLEMLVQFRGLYERIPQAF